MRAFHNLTVEPSAVSVDGARLNRPPYFSVTEWLELWEAVKAYCDGDDGDPDGEDLPTARLREKLAAARLELSVLQRKYDAIADRDGFPQVEALR